MGSKNKRENVPGYIIGNIGYLMQLLNSMDKSFCYMDLNNVHATVIVSDRKGHKKIFRHYFLPDGTAGLSIEDQGLKKAHEYLVGLADVATGGEIWHQLQ